MKQTLDAIQALGIAEPEKWTDRDRLLLLVNSYEQSKWVADEIRLRWQSMSDSVYHLAREIDRDADDSAQPELPRGALVRADIETFGQSGGKILVAPTNAIGRGFNILNAERKAAFGAVYFVTRPYPHPHDTQRISQELNRRSLDWEDDPTFLSWQEDGIQQRAESVRREALQCWRSAEYRSYYSTLRDNEAWSAYPRKDLSATTAGVMVQAVGRLLRGGVPFHAYFVDAAWGANYAASGIAETPRTSLLAAIIDLLEDYVHDDFVCQALYEPLADAITDIENFDWRPHT